MKTSRVKLNIIIFLSTFFISCFPFCASSNLATDIAGKSLNKIANIVSKGTVNKAVVTGKVVGGSSTALAAKIGNKAGYAAHHLIPCELRNHRVLQKIGMNLDEAENGISLPNIPGLDPKLPLHRGSHPAYTTAVENELNKIPENLSVKETVEAVKNIQIKFRTKLENGEPLHAINGGHW